MTGSSRLIAARRATIESTGTHATSFSFNNNSSSNSSTSISSSSSTTSTTTSKSDPFKKKLIKKKNSFVEELKEHVAKELERNNNNEQDNSLLQRQFTSKFNLVQEAFDTLSDVFVFEMEKMTKKMDTQWKEMNKRLFFLETSFEKIQNQTSNLYSRSTQQKEIQEKHFHQTQQAMELLNQNFSETQVEFNQINHHKDQLESQQKEMMRLLETLKISQDQTTKALTKIKQEKQQQDIDFLKQQWNQTTIALTNDVQVLAKECTSLRNFMSQQMSSCSSKMDELKETFDRQLTMGFTHWRQKLDTCQKQWISFERVTKESIQKLYQNHSQIRFALNENMKINTNEVKNLSKELNNLKEVQQIKMDQWFDQFTTHSIECTKTKDRLQRHLQIIAHALELSIK